MTDPLKKKKKKKDQIQDIWAEPIFPDDRVQADQTPLHTERDLTKRQPGIITLGGLEEVPGRPRIVEGQPIRNIAAARPIAERSESGAADKLREIFNKDYSSAEYNSDGELIKHAGKDRDKKWSLGDKILSALQGAFNGDGAIPAATDRNYREKLADRREIERLAPIYQMDQQMQKDALANERATLQNTNLALEPLMDMQRIEQNQQRIDQGQQRVDITAEKAVNDAKYKQEVISLGRQRAEDLRAYRDAIIDLKERGADQNDERIRLLEKRIDETIRSNKVREGQNSQRIAGQTEDRRERLKKWAADNKVTRAKFKADLEMRVSLGRMTRAQADQALADFDN